MINVAWTVLGAVVGIFIAMIRIDDKKHRAFENGFDAGKKLAENDLAAMKKKYEVEKILREGR